MPAHFSPSNRRFFFKTLLITGLLCSLSTAYALYYLLVTTGLEAIQYFILEYLYLQPFKWVFTILVALWVHHKLGLPLLFVGIMAIVHALVLLVATVIAPIPVITTSLAIVLSILIPKPLLDSFRFLFDLLFFLEIYIPQLLAPLLSGWLALKLTYARPFQPIPPDAPNRYDDLHF
jgi:hypothetical protein